jgi:alginate O-acetyltransferase complex protein AlgF
MSLPSVAALFVGCALVTACLVEAGQPQLYPTGPKGGAAFVRFVNTASRDISITSGLARIDLPASGARRATEFRAVVPGTTLSAALQATGLTRPITLVLARNEVATVAIGDAPNGPTPIVFREIPNDFNALKVSIALYNADEQCRNAQLLAGVKKIQVVSGIRPAAFGRRTMNPVNVEIFGNCGGETDPLPVHLGNLEAGERYSVVLFAPANSGAFHLLALHDEIEPSHP